MLPAVVPQRRRRQPVRGSRRHALLGLFVALGACDTPVPSSSFHDRLLRLGAMPCEAATDPTFVCGTIDVPTDHSQLGGPTQPLAFAGRSALGASSLGVVLSIAGGPGYSGIDEVDDWTTTDPTIAQRFDLLTFDLRGVERSAKLDCPHASSAWYTGGLRGSTAPEQRALIARAMAYAADCPTEAGIDASGLALYTTAQAAEDIESLRSALAVDSMSIYGLSYGTQLAQTYATAHPDRVRAVVLDGVIDLNGTERAYATSLQAAVDGIVDRTLAACAGDAACAAEVGSDAGASYDAIATALDGAPQAIEFPLAGGGTRHRALSRGDFDSVSALAADNPGSRTRFLQALGAAHERGDFVPLRTLLDDLDAIDPATELVEPSGFSDAVYYTFTATDYGHPAGGAADYVSGATAILATHPRTITSYFGDLPMSIWPGAPAELLRPLPFASPAPVLLIDAEADAATPVVQGRAVLAAGRAAGLPIREVAVSGGHHVMASDNACVDAALAAFLFDPDAEVALADATCVAPFVLPYAATLHMRRRTHRRGHARD